MGPEGHEGVVAKDILPASPTSRLRPIATMAKSPPRAIKVTADTLPTSGKTTTAAITGVAPHSLARIGLLRTFQVVQPFAGLTSRDNVAAAALFAGSWRPPGGKPTAPLSASGSRM